MKSKWNKATLNDCIKIIIDYRGKTPNKLGGDWSENGYRALSAKNVKTIGGIVQEDTIRRVDNNLYNKWMKEEVMRGDILMTSEAPLGELLHWNTDEKIVLSQRLFAIRAQDYINSTYLFYYMTSSEYQHELESRATGTTVIGIKQTELIQTIIKYPSLPIQKKIAHILSTLDDKIELNRKMNQTLESMASAIFKSWFVDFDPVHAKANCTNGAELENIAKKLGISKAILDLFPNEFEESELGMIPKGWEVVKIEEILKRYQAPKRYKKEAVESFGKTVVLEQGVNIILGYHDGEAEFQATEDEPMFIFGDHTCIMKLSTKPFSISENVIPLSGLIRNGYWTYYATYGQQTFQEYRRHWSELIVKEIVMSDKLLCDLFAKQVKPLILKIEQNILENNELAKTRDTLLPKLLSGEIDVSDLSLEME
ncbi:restriction endonuclease subunit S [Aliarcobacter butzleri]|uniref:restriction endonuclease subunit S n=1 Tax=Aliarcobacter butzleri TaxID=28197 RepID=UPI0021B42BC6|nr:restriction endonuclease subunit S [Aliarcobacter butzleri]MCT7594242.1 restriction endonuclease subunit S [Aliarcobacter butzleri]MCT7598865.1 restriction endonuclease subunit S [Aliarcobacter butzleri]MCT7652811.1 restriction endonuclease subunit S [Aliarcobacter butzleri]